MGSIEFKNGFPLFSNSVSRSSLTTHEKIRVSDIWAYWDYLIKVYRTRNRKEQYNFLASLLEQSKYFYLAAESAPLKSKPLLYYYSFLNLAKIIINIHSYLGTNVRYDHGIVTNVVPGTTISDAHVYIKQLGSIRNGMNVLSVAKRFFEVLGDDIPFVVGIPYSINIMDCLHSCVGIHRTFCETYSVKESFYRLKDINGSNPCSLDKNGHSLIFDVVVDRCTSTIAAHLQTEGYNLRYNNGLYHYTDFVNLGPRYNVTSSDLKVFSEQLMKRGLWSYSDGNEYRFYIGEQKLKISSASVIYCIMFFFGSITRYYPYLFESILSDKELWLVSEFLNTQPKQFMYYVTSKVVGDYIYKSKAADL